MDITLRLYGHWPPRSPIGRSGPPKQDHARLHLACIYLLIFYGIYLEQPSGNRAGKGLFVVIPALNGQEASAGAGAGRAKEVPPGRGRSAEVCHGRRMRCECNLGNGACEYRFANERRARRQS
eukprot:6199609-Pleurochrysis_carterae.AAC.1